MKRADVLLKTPSYSSAKMASRSSGSSPSFNNELISIGDRTGLKSSEWLKSCSVMLKSGAM